MTPDDRMRRLYELVLVAQAEGAASASYDHDPGIGPSFPPACAAVSQAWDLLPPYLQEQIEREHRQRQLTEINKDWGEESFAPAEKQVRRWHDAREFRSEGFGDDEGWFEDPDMGARG